MTFEFAQLPKVEDYCSLADHVVTVSCDRLHSALWPRRGEVADRLRRMGEEPGREAHRAAYHALRLMLW